mmetsp:Transcript_69986/g.202994  ORF Transcript_69986/g.202994 Transcript_69986/m.202994 type:complete len:221 (-) Transcript_69986:17-679(-)
MSSRWATWATASTSSSRAACRCKCLQRCHVLERYMWTRCAHARSGPCRTWSTSRRVWASERWRYSRISRARRPSRPRMLQSCWWSVARAMSSTPARCTGTSWSSVSTSCGGVAPSRRRCRPGRSRPKTSQRPRIASTKCGSPATPSLPSKATQRSPSSWSAPANCSCCAPSTSTPSPPPQGPASSARGEAAGAWPEQRPAESSAAAPEPPASSPPTPSGR